ncbi:RHS repeat domain-containing protein [Paenibacillus xylanexedens]|uniref:RHS repeat domain-containing protein n=1 Tax=Paenibacillus xylanexedens TaxID=528191 RepID=UPI003CFE73BB
MEVFKQRNRLTEVDTEEGKVGYRCNGDGLMVERTGLDETKTRYYYDDRKLLVAEGTIGSDGRVSITVGYVYDASGELQARQVSGETGLQTYWKNGHGDVTELKNAAGDTLNRYTYDVWGNSRVIEEQTPNVLRYAGEYWDEETGLQCLRSRWYDPNLGRFINEDTYEGYKAEPNSLNLYTYVENNPLIYVDSSGESKRPVKNSLEGLGSGSGSASGGAGRPSGGSFGGGGSKGGSSGSKPSSSSNGQSSAKGINKVSSAKDLIGKDFEEFLTKQLGGNGIFSKGGRDFDGGVGSKWWEAKSGEYWNKIMEGKFGGVAKFKSDMGARLEIAKQNDATYFLYSNSRIPQTLKDWLTKKGIGFKEFLD